MYVLQQKEDTIRIPPHRLSENLDEVTRDITRETLEGTIDGKNKLIIMALNIRRDGDGKVVHGDGGIFQKIIYDALIFELEEHEIVLGYVCEVLKFGAFIRFGPLDGLLHISQIMNDKIDINLGNQRLRGKESNKELGLSDKIRARIVTMSVNQRSPRESKIGLTMRQQGLGKMEWIEEEMEAS